MNGSAVVLTLPVYCYLLRSLSSSLTSLPLLSPTLSLSLISHFSPYPSSLTSLPIPHLSLLSHSSLSLPLPHLSLLSHSSLPLPHLSTVLPHLCLSLISLPLPRYILLTLDQYVEQDYTLLYFHHGFSSINKPSIAWLRQIYHELDRK